MDEVVFIKAAEEKASKTVPGATLKMKQSSAICAVLVVLCFISWSPRAICQTTADVCRDTSDCPANHCCMLGHYSGVEPSCQQAPKENDTCRPGNTPRNATIYDRDSKPKYSVTNVYDSVCPCSQGLTCDANSGGVCKKST